MKLSLFSVGLIAGSLVATAQQQNDAKNSGVFYTTILAKENLYLRLADFGSQANAFFLRDIDGDGKDDAVILDGLSWSGARSDGEVFAEPAVLLTYASQDVSKNQALMGDVNGDGKSDAILFDPEQGNWYISLSDGNSFAQPVLWSAGNGAGSTKRFLADVNGDGNDDAIIYFHVGLFGYWYVGLSNGQNGFGGFSPWISGFGDQVEEHLVADVDGDGKADALIFERSTGNWSVALSDGTKFTAQGTWKNGFGANADQVFAYDVDRDGKADICYIKDFEWWVCYAMGNSFNPAYNHRWITQHRPATMISRGHKPVPKANLLGSVSGDETIAIAISSDEWLGLENPDKGKTVESPLVDTWVAWGNPYTPVIGTYDAGDDSILDAQIKMIHDAGFTYIMLDITNGGNQWVDQRAVKLAERVQVWNTNLKPSDHRMYICVSMGSSRGLSGQAAADRVELESKRTWDEFYIPFQEAYYRQGDKPLLIHFVETPDQRTSIQAYAQSMPFFQRFTVRWMFNEVKDETVYRNTYGWPLLSADGTPRGDEVMAVSPGFWNGGVGVSRGNGSLYANHWLRVLENNPASVWLNSFNETWEHTSVEPARLDAAAAAANPSLLQVWTDYYNTPMDDFYWVMTKQYNRLFMYRELFEGCYLREKDSEDVFVVRRDTIAAYGRQMPRMAPVLLVPRGFINAFEGNVINDDLVPVGEIRGVEQGKDVIDARVVSNILTPNNDGINDYWLIAGIEHYPNNTVKILDRQGRVVFEKKGYRNEWQGRRWGGNHHGEVLPEGVYTYQIEYGDAAKKPIRGYITLLHDVQRNR